MFDFLESLETEVNSDPNKKVSFREEKQLVNAFVSLFGDRNKHPFRLAHEVESLNGIADLVLFRTAKNQYSPRLADLQPRWVYSLKVLPYRKYFSTTDFSELTHVSEKTASRVLEDFVAAGFCKRKEKNWIKTTQPKAVGTEIIAIEAKLKDWNKALKQAYRYLDFAHQTWVLLDEAHSSGAKKRLDLFSRLNVGLATLSSAKNITVLHAPLKQAPRSELRFWQANVLLARQFKP